ANGYARAILSANLARIRLQKIAGGRRTAHRRVRPLVSQPRARRPAPSRIHHGRMVSGPGALRGPDGGLRSYSCARGGGGGLEAVLVPRSRHRSVRRPRAADGGGSVCAPRRHRSLGNAAAAARGRLRRRRPCRRRPHGGRRYLGRHFQPRAGREDRTAPRARARDDPLRISGGAIAARPAEKPRAAARRALRALRLRGRACERLRRTHRRGRATQTARTPDGGKGAHLSSALSDRRGFSERPCGDAGGLRDCARLRSAGAARDRSRSHRRGDVDAHVRDVNDREMKGQRMLPFRAELRIFIVVAAAARAQPAWAQAYATQNITLQVAFAAGGIADVVARLVGQKLSERFGQVVVVENRGGAGGNLAAKAVSGAAPDGYTILATTTSLAVNETATKNKGFSVGELRAIAIVAFSPDVLAVHPSNPAKDLNEFIDNGKNRSFTYGSAGVGTGPHIGAEYFFREIAKVQAVHVPFTGGGPAVTAAIGNHVDAIVLTLPTVVPSITQGLLRGIGLASATRNSAVPNVPTYGEMGFPNVYSGSWVGFFAPAKTPDAVVAKLNAEINAIMQEPPAQEKLKTIGFDVMIKTVGEATDYFRSEVASWGKMTRAIGYSSD